MQDPTGLDLSQLRAALEAGALTSASLVQAFLARIAAHDTRGAGIRAMTALHPDAPEQARRLDRERAAGLVRGPLHGIPIVVKDNIDVRGLPTAAACAALRDHRPARDAQVVRRLRDAGAIVLGKANMSELACSNGRYGYSSLGGLTLNPYNRARNAAGSSSGSAAAVAAGFAPAALGTDSFGSVRAPACVTGLAGLRPTHGLLPVEGVLPLALSFDTVGPMARCVRDVALLLRAMSSAMPGAERDEYLDGLREDAARGARIGVVVDYPGQDEEVRAAMQAAQAILRGLGAILVPFKLPEPPLQDGLVAASGGGAHADTAASGDGEPSYTRTLYPGLLSPLAEAEWPAQLDAFLAAGIGGGPRDMARLLAAAQAWSAAHPGRAVNPRTLAGMQRALEQAARRTAAQRTQAQAALAAYRAAVVHGMRRLDLAAAIFPTLSCPASPRYDREDPTYVPYPGNAYAGLYVASAAGLPEISVPAGMARAGVPMGVSFMGAPYDEARLLGLAHAFEQARGRCPAPVLD
ncbi:amidase [Bordetella bronchialis]|uniref:amidase n=1 Tax=Bordetella bronchialis TaxID=463025 RepID=UPI000B2F16BB|nr:amidase [Bordetella bronchialis]